MEKSYNNLIINIKVNFDRKWKMKIENIKMYT